MKILKFFGWALLSLFVLFLVILIIMAIFDYTTDDMEVVAKERTTQPLSEDCVSLFCAYLQKDDETTALEALISGFTDTDIILLQNCEESNIGQLESLFESHNAYFSFSKRSPISFSGKGKVSFLDFSGLYTLTAFSPSTVRKLLLPTDTNWFNSLLSPTPSIQIVEFEKNGKQLFIVNLDNEMNDQWESQEINASRLEYIKKSVIETLPQDAYFVLAGNWQNNLPGQGIINANTTGNEIPMDWTKTGWQWIYQPDEISGYGVLVSGNVQVQEYSFIKSPSENPTNAVSLVFCLE